MLNAWRVFGGCLEGFWRVTGGCLEGGQRFQLVILKVSGPAKFFLDLLLTTAKMRGHVDIQRTCIRICWVYTSANVRVELIGIIKWVLT